MKNIFFLYTFLLAMGLFQFAQAAEDTATYKVTFINQWNAADHISFPRNAHYSPIVAVSHTSDYQLYAIGGFATSGFEDFAETGATSELVKELTAARGQGHVSDVTVTGALFPHRDGDLISLEINVSKSAPLLSFATMIAPSPDWVVGINDLNTMLEGQFVDSFDFDLYAINAGTEEGDFGGNFSINNRPTSPQEPIGFFNMLMGLDRPFARATVIRVR